MVDRQGVSGGRGTVRGAGADGHRAHHPVMGRITTIAGLLTVLAGGPALAQPGVELELGGSYHYAIDLGGDWFTFPSTPAVDFRATKWGEGRWGVAGRAMLGLGGLLVGEYSGYRRRPSYFQILARYRAEDGVHFGIGGGLIAFEEDGRIGFGMHLLGAEALVSRRLTDRLSIRFGASAVVPISVNPIVLLAW